LEILHSQPFDVLVTDVKMPGASGLSLVDRAMALSPGILIFVMTGHYQEIPPDTQDKVFRWILKPFDIASVRTWVIEALETRK
jgi:two-component system NtrC family response regulator